MTKHIVMTEANGDSVLTTTKAPEFDANDFPKGWSGVGLEASGVFMFILKVDKVSEEFAIHSSEDEWLAYVMSGSGTLYAGTATNQKTTNLAYQTGDFITFAKNTPHGWLDDGMGSKFLFVKQA